MSRDVRTLHSCSHWLRPRNVPLPPHFGSYMRGTIGQLRKTTPPCNPLHYYNEFCSSADPHTIECRGWILEHWWNVSENSTFWKAGYSPMFLKNAKKGTFPSLVKTTTLAEWNLKRTGHVQWTYIIGKVTKLSFHSPYLSVFKEPRNRFWGI
jgi:hypothetical protein